jgi:hypothetical protein
VKQIRRERGANQYDAKRPVYDCECGDHCFANLTKGYVVMISPQDKGMVSQYSWSAIIMTSGLIRAVRRINKTKSYFYMHREIMKPDDNCIVDHVNGLGIDNRRNNLRLCSPAQNMANTRRARNKSSKTPKGVYFDKVRGNYQSYVTANGVRHRLGRFKDVKSAVAARDEYAAALHGNFATSTDVNAMQFDPRGLISYCGNTPHVQRGALLRS